MPLPRTFAATHCRILIPAAAAVRYSAVVVGLLGCVAAPPTAVVAAAAAAAALKPRRGCGSGAVRGLDFPSPPPSPPGTPRGPGSPWRVTRLSTAAAACTSPAPEPPPPLHQRSQVPRQQSRNITDAAATATRPAATQPPLTRPITTLLTPPPQPPCQDQVRTRRTLNATTETSGNNLLPHFLPWPPLAPAITCPSRRPGPAHHHSAGGRLAPSTPGGAREPRRHANQG